ncbi:MAG: rhodanese-like domain-containing protein [Methanobacterium sp.]|jgi:rhodanese-related sulfurtransferase|nr:rhodanese-like domain-containing protein [Methanobacterium sp.]
MSESDENEINQVIRNLSPEVAHKLLEENLDNPDFIILDIRTSKEFSTGHIEGALNLDFYADDFQEQIEKGDKDKKYLICCGSGVRSSKLLKTMGYAGYLEVYNVLGGMRMWEKSNLPLTQE